MIYAITPNPTLDVAGVVDKIIPNEKNYVRDEMRIPGGNGVNAGRIIDRLDQPVTCLGFLGGSTGSEIKKLLKEEGLKSRFTPIEGNTRMNLTVSVKASHNQTRLSFPGPTVKAADILKMESDLTKLKKRSIILFGGSLPPGMEAKRVSSMIRSLQEAGHTCIVDCPGPALKSIIKAKPFFIKPNLQEFQSLTNTRLKSLDSVLKKALELTKLVPLVCISSVEGGAILACKNAAWFGKIPKIKIKSTVGAGDSMVGAISSRLFINKLNKLASEDLDEFLIIHGEELLRWGLASSCATLSVSGITQGSKKDIINYLNKVSVKNIKKL